MTNQLNHIPSEAEHASAIEQARLAAQNSDDLSASQYIPGSGWGLHLLKTPDTEMEVKLFSSSDKAVKGTAEHPLKNGGKSHIVTRVSMGPQGQMKTGETILTRYDEEGKSIRWLSSANPLVARVANVAMANTIVNHSSEPKRITKERVRP